jgi:hypothetical protein
MAIGVVGSGFQSVVFITSVIDKSSGFSDKLEFYLLLSDVRFWVTVFCL